jgi:hypothetical protein
MSIEKRVEKNSSSGPGLSRGARYESESIGIQQACPSYRGQPTRPLGSTRDGARVPPAISRAKPRGLGGFETGETSSVCRRF